MAFEIHGPYPLYLKPQKVPDSKIQIRYVLREKSMTNLEHKKIPKRPGGVYVFAIRKRGKGSGIPWYVGKNEGNRKSSLYREALDTEKLGKYIGALAEEVTGSAWLYFLSPGNLKSDDIGELETFLIWLARQRNPRLLNRRNVRLTPKRLYEHLQKHRIKGMLGSRAGKPPKGTPSFRKMIGWTRAMHVGTFENPLA